MEKLIDLHTHTSASDGSLAPSEFILECKKENIGAVAITDHDTTDAVSECMSSGKEFGIRVIPGIEISAEFYKELHILGLFIDHTSPYLLEFKENLLKFRKERNIKMLNNLKISGMDISNDKNVKSVDIKNLGRVHMALALVENGFAEDISDAFKKYLSRETPYYEERKKYTIEESIKTIHNAGGLAFLAHPNHTCDDFSSLETLIRIMKGYGLDGIECYHTSMTPHFTSLCIKCAEKYNLLVSGGSDFHGENRHGARLGRAYDGKELKYDILKKIEK